MALKRPVSAVTAKEAALKDTAALKSVAERLDPKDAITREGKPTNEQALAESSTQSATSDRKGVEDYEQASSGGGGAGESTADVIVSVADLTAAAGRKEISDYEDIGKATGTGAFAKRTSPHSSRPRRPSAKPRWPPTWE